MSVYRVGTNKSSINNFPSVRPSLDLDFANTKALDPRITFTRSSGGSYVGADGLIKYAGVNEARFDHNPVTGESLGLLIEESRANSWINSGQNNVIGWGFTPGCISFDNTQTAPDGTTNTIKFTERPVFTSGMGFNQVLSVTSGTSYTFSVFAKQPNNSPLRYLSILFFNTGFGEFKIATFNPVSGNVLYTSGTLTTSAQKYPNGWWRFSVTGTATATTTSPFDIRFTNSVNSSGGLGGPFGNYTGDGSSFLYFYGPQVETGAFPTSYIPTTTSSRTRAADNASMTGRNFSSWYNQTGYSVFTSHIAPITQTIYFPRIFNIGTDASDINRLNFYHTPSSVGYKVGMSVVENNPISNVNFATPTSQGTKLKLAGAFAENNSYLYINGSIIGTDIKCSINSVTRNILNIGSANNNSAYLNSTIAKFTYYPKALPPSQLQVLTR